MIIFTVYNWDEVSKWKQDLLIWQFISKGGTEKLNEEIKETYFSLFNLDCSSNFLRRGDSLNFASASAYFF